MDQASGSAKKVHVAQLILSIARAIDDIDKNKAVISILKNRSGKSGKIFNNVKFDNGTCTISCDEIDEFDDTLTWKEESEKISNDFKQKLLIDVVNKARINNEKKQESTGNFVGQIITK